jgi:DNA-binding transcriptional LysR family regulator
LLYFAEVARCGSIRQAADRLHVAPSAISRQIQLLEHELGATLFVRNRRGVVMTEHGQLLRQFAGDLGRDLDRLRGEFSDLVDLRSGHVTIAAVDAATSRLLPACFAAFQGAHPGVSIHVHVVGTHGVAEKVLRQEAHIGVALDPPFRSELQLRARWPQPLQGIVRPDHPFAARTSLSLATLLTVPHCMLDRSCGTRTLIERAAAEAGVSPKPMVETNSLEMAKRLAMTGHSATVLPPEFVHEELAAGELVAIPLEDPPLARASIDVFTARGRPLPRAAEAVLAELRRAIVGHRA